MSVRDGGVVRGLAVVVATLVLASALVIPLAAADPAAPAALTSEERPGHLHQTDANRTSSNGGVTQRDLAHPDGLVFVDVRATPSEPTPDRNFSVTASVLNSRESGESFIVRELQVLNGTATDADPLNGTDPDRRVYPGESATTSVSVGVDNPGERTLGVRVRLQSTNGAWTNIVRPVSVDVRQPHPGLAVSAADTLPGSPGNVTVTLSNGMDVPARNVELTLRPTDVSVDDRRRVASTVPAGGERTFTFVASGPTAGEETFDAHLAYTAGNGSRYDLTRSLETRFRPPANPGAVNLTGLSVVRDGDQVVVRGTASNVGNTDVSSVLVAAASADRVRPARSNAEYFVGQIPASDYASFEVRAQVTDNASTVSIPLRVSYLVDGVRRERTVRVAYHPPDPTEPTSSSDGGLPLSGVPLVAVGGLGVVVVGGAGWRWVRGDE